MRWRDRGLRRPRRRQVRNRNILRGFDLLESFDEERCTGIVYGAIMTRAPGIGSFVSEIVEGTWDSQLSSSEDSLLGFDVYHEPAWLASRVLPMLFCNAFEISWLWLQILECVCCGFLNDDGVVVDMMRLS